MSILALLLLLTSPAHATEDADEPVIAGELGSRAHAWVERMVPLGFSGAALLVRDGEVLLAQAYGEADRARGVPARIDSVWPLGSISKHFTAAAVLKLQMQGRLSVDDRLDALLDDVPRDKAGITLHQLLTHTSGLPEASGAGAPATSAAEHLAHAYRTGLVFPPGEDVGYSNIGYGVLAAVVEQVSGQSFERTLRAEVLLPAGMTHTGVTLASWEDDAVARGMIDGADRGRLDAGFGPAPWWLLGAGGLQTTLGDMRRWSAALRDHTVLDQESVAAMTRVHVLHGPGAGAGYGCGVMTTPRGGTMIGHNGSDDVFMADWRLYLEDGVTVFVTSNHADVYADVVSDALLRLTFGYEVPLPPEVLPLPPEALARYAGAWELESGGVIEVRARDAGLLVGSPDAAGARLVHPVPPHQEARREELLAATREAFERAAAGDFAPLHGLLDPYAPAELFVEDHRQMLAQWTEERGELAGVTTLPGRNRFGEIAVVVELAYPRDPVRIEYSFGEEEVGSIRLVRELPARLVQPLGPAAFVSWDPESDQRWLLGFELDADGAPVALTLGDARGVRR